MSSEHALAIQCLSELRNLNVVAKPAERLLQEVCSLFDHISSWEHTRFIDSQIMPSVEAIGSKWPQENTLKNWLANHKQFKGFWRYDESLAQFIGIVGAENDAVHTEVLKRTRHRSDSHRALAVTVLSQGWRNDPRTLQIARKLVVEDASDSVRDAAVAVLYRYFSEDEGTLPTLKDRILNDVSWMVRSSAVIGLARHIPEDLALSDLLKDRILNDPSEHVRSMALYPFRAILNEPDNLLLVRHCATEDTSNFVRQEAIQLLASERPHEPETLTIIHDRIANDAHTSVRYQSIRLMGQFFRTDPKTLPLLHQIVKSNEPTNLRYLALRILSEHFRGDPKHGCRSKSVKSEL